MDDVRLAPLVGIVGCLGVLAALSYPYVLADGSVGTYYGSGMVNPLVAGLFAAVTLIALAAGHQGRADPGLAAGAALVFGAAMVAIGLAWGLTVRVDAVAVSGSHRWSIAAVSALVAVGSAWYTRALGVV